MDRPKIVAMLPVRNETHRYLKLVLSHLTEYIDEIVILDDASTDETPEICRSFSKVTRFKSLDESLFWRDEAALRNLLWEMTIELDPDWILALDADEIFESTIKKELSRLTQQNQYDLVYFPVYHFWGCLTHYRVDGMWNPLYSKIGCLFRYHKNIDYHWPMRKLHCGRFPLEVCKKPATLSSINLLHLGYAQKNEHYSKYRQYLSADPEGKYCPITHYQSIVHNKYQLKRWLGEKINVGV